ncbi:RidA family protein [Microbacterium sp. W4I20]|uniref:RidA family protein n=1 Tax=Microbacterium sp. W4I20 TaxID=3042262 RepID=UPI002789EA7C|nr:RidA family protein [Microbacterium sp. W4I20]MDQ0726607.1 2-iminobutanoate/2-iminopropanoate deaminase [Microbacterium sp. W4I20]
MDRQIVTTTEAPAIGAQFALSQGMRIGPFLQTSGQVGQDPTTGEVVSGGFADQVQQTLVNVTAILRAGGASLRDVLMMRVYVREARDLPEMNRVYSEFVGATKPPRTTIVTGLPGPFLVEIDALAVVNQA